MVIGISGLDMTDEGYLLSIYQQFFKYPESINSYSIYNTILIGGLWESVFGNWGIIGFRLLAALCVTFISAIVFLLCRKIISRLWLLIGLGVVFLSGHYIFVFHYNQTSALVALLAALFIFKNKKEDTYRVIKVMRAQGHSYVARGDISDLEICELPRHV